MRRRCSELYLSGEYVYAEVHARADGSHEVRVSTRDARECRTVYRRVGRGRVEVLEDEDVL
ncbi:MAG: hypothetical protein QXM71_07140 [Thermofilum sp.]